MPDGRGPQPIGPARPSVQRPLGLPRAPGQAGGSGRWGVCGGAGLTLLPAERLLCPPLSRGRRSLTSLTRLPPETSLWAAALGPSQSPPVRPPSCLAPLSSTPGSPAARPGEQTGWGRGVGRTDGPERAPTDSPAVDRGARAPPPAHRPRGHKLGDGAGSCWRAPQECCVARCCWMAWLAQSLTRPPATSRVCVIAQRGAWAPGLDRPLPSAPRRTRLHAHLPLRPPLSRNLGPKERRWLWVMPWGFGAPRACAPQTVQRIGSSSGPRAHWKRR